MKLGSEDGILAVIARHFPEGGRGVLLGRGDDCAVLAPCGPRAVTTDIFAEGAHFRRSYFSAFDIGWKAMAVNVSDLAAQGARPSGVSVGLTLTGAEDAEWLDGFCTGMEAMARMHGVALTGGDLTRAGTLSVCITAWGDMPPELPLGLRRGVAREGDAVFLMGGIGLARLGLGELERAALLSAGEVPREVERLKAVMPAAIAAHLHPVPRVDEGRAAAAFAAEHGLGERMGMMDVSDGLARDLPRLLASASSGLGADVVLPCSLLHAGLVEMLGAGAPEHAFRGGEDYALAGTCPAEHFDAFVGAMQAAGVLSPVRIGTVRRGGIVLNGAPWKDAGFDHFS